MAVVYPVNGKVAFVTGAARGIGFETAKLLHARGASVAIMDLEQEDAQSACDAIGPRTLAIAGDVTDRSALERAVSEIVERFGGLDIAVANAGIAPPVRPMTVIGEEMFDRVVDIDLMGVVHTVRAVLPQVVERGGHIVVIASIYAFVNGVLAAPYAMSKAGVEQLGRALRTELRIHGASASVAYFGFIDTSMVQDAFADPIAKQLEETYPKWMLKRLHPSEAGKGIVDGIEKRAPRIIRPRWWAIWSTGRGLINPVFDRLMDRDENVERSVRDGEAAGRAER